MSDRTKPKATSVKSRLENKFHDGVIENGLNRYGYDRQFKFATSPPLTRWPTFLPPPKKADTRWRAFTFDFAWPDVMLAVEIEGGIGFTKGGHMQTSGVKGDIEKQNAAVMLGWTVLRFHTNQVDSGEAIRTVMRWIQLYADDAGPEPSWLLWYGFAPIGRQGVVMAVSEVEGSEQLRIVEPGRPNKPVGSVLSSIAIHRKSANANVAHRDDRVAALPDDVGESAGESETGHADRADHQGTVRSGSGSSTGSRPLHGSDDDRDAPVVAAESDHAGTGTGRRTEDRRDAADRGVPDRPRDAVRVVHTIQPKHRELISWVDLEDILKTKRRDVRGGWRQPAFYDQSDHWLLFGPNGLRITVRAATISVGAGGRVVKLKSTKTPHVTAGDVITFEQIGGERYVKPFVRYLLTKPPLNRSIAWGPITGTIGTYK